ncbi:hypothetical protein ACF0H5_011500 [Mactra antiquata]
MSDPCLHNNCSPVDMEEPTFSLSSKISITALCLAAVLFLVLGGRALKYSSKLPRPFNTICLIVVVSDLILGILTGLQPWIEDLMAYEKEISTLGALIVIMTTTLVSIERAYALKCPLKYIVCSGNDRLTNLICVSTFVTLWFLYLFVRLLVCYMLRYTVEQEECTPYQLHFITISVIVLVVITTLCFGLVVHTIVKNRVQHTRRITRMGLPTNYASSANDTHISAILFVLYPCMICLAITSLIIPFTVIIRELIVSVWLSIACRVCVCCVHAMVFNIWFDEGRLHFLTLLSPFSQHVRDRVEVMRINVYNMVIAQAFEGSRASFESGSYKRKTSQKKSLNSRPNLQRKNVQSVSEHVITITVKGAQLENIAESNTEADK